VPFVHCLQDGPKQHLSYRVRFWNRAVQHLDIAALGFVLEEHSKMPSAR
jgi:hypothetical protein